MNSIFATVADLETKRPPSEEKKNAKPRHGRSKRSKKLSPMAVATVAKTSSK